MNLQKKKKIEVDDVANLRRSESPVNGIKNPLLRIKNQLHTLILHLHPKPLRILHHLHLHILHPNKPLRKLPYLRRQFRHHCVSPLLLLLLLVIITILLLNDDFISEIPVPFSNRFAGVRDSGEPIHNSRFAEQIINTPRPNAVNVFLIALIIIIVFVFILIVNNVVAVVVIGRAGGNRERAAVERVHEREVRPRGVAVALLRFGAVALAELLDFVAALKGGLGGGFGVVVTATGGDSDGDFFPIGSFELAAFERVPFFLVSLDQMDSFFVSPREWL